MSYECIKKTINREAVSKELFSTAPVLMSCIEPATVIGLHVQRLCTFSGAKLSNLGITKFEIVVRAKC